MRKIIFIALLSIISVHAFTQNKKEKRAARAEKINALIKQEEEGILVFKKHFIYGGGLATDGYGIFAEKGIKQDKRKTTLYRIELYEKKHVKEERLNLQANSFGATNTVIQYKLNNFFQLKLGYGMQYLIGGKGNKNGVEVTAVGVGGITMGLLKPYYLNVQDSRGVRTQVTYDTPDTTQYFLIGASGLSKGINETKIRPGIFTKTGLRFDYGKYNEMVNSIEVGICTEFYTNKIPQMFLLKQRNLFLSLYVSVLLGRRK